MLSVWSEHSFLVFFWILLFFSIDLTSFFFTLNWFAGVNFIHQTICVWFKKKSDKTSLHNIITWTFAFNKLQFTYLAWFHKINHLTTYHEHKIWFITLKKCIKSRYKVNRISIFSKKMKSYLFLHISVISCSLTLQYNML
jgi:hypothetical protein